MNSPRYRRSLFRDRGVLRSSAHESRRNWRSCFSGAKRKIDRGAISKPKRRAKHGHTSLCQPGLLQDDDHVVAEGQEEGEKAWAQDGKVVVGRDRVIVRDHSEERYVVMSLCMNFMHPIFQRGADLSYPRSSFCSPTVGVTKSLIVGRLL